MIYSLNNNKAKRLCLYSSQKLITIYSLNLKGNRKRELLPVTQFKVVGALHQQQSLFPKTIQLPGSKYFHVDRAIKES